jgi:hypothetical protein
MTHKKGGKPANENLEKSEWDIKERGIEGQ